MLTGHSERGGKLERESARHGNRALRGPLGGAACEWLSSSWLYPLEV